VYDINAMIKQVQFIKTSKIMYPPMLTKFNAVKTPDIVNKAAKAKAIFVLVTKVSYLR
jgi:hypothetical protein